jgi:hypothetical protein
LTGAAVVLAGCLIGLGACDRGGGGAKSAANAPATAPVIVGVVGPVQLTIMGTPAAFPAARARVVRKAGALYVQVFSEGPAGGQGDGGDTFYFDMNIDADDVATDDGGKWTYRTASRERSDLPIGISLTGGRQQLQPRDVEADLRLVGDRLAVKLSGRFAVFLDDATTSTQEVSVQGELVAAVEPDAGPTTQGGGRP